MIASSGPGGHQNQVKGLRSYLILSMPVAVAILAILPVALVLGWMGWLAWALLSPPPVPHGQVTPTSVWTTGGSITSLAFSPDGQLLAIGMQDGSVELRRVGGNTLL